MQKWPNERFVKTRAVSGFIFLRLLCPAILNPRSFNLISGKNESNTDLTNDRTVWNIRTCRGKGICPKMNKRTEL